jgi:AcrR family transcriptional regulator
MGYAAATIMRGEAAQKPIRPGEQLRGNEADRRTDQSFFPIAEQATRSYGCAMDMVTPAGTDSPADGAPVQAPPRERLLTAATRLFCRYGINSVGVDAIVEAAGTAKATLYNSFGSKDGLVEAVLEREGRAWRAWFLDEIDGPGGPAGERLARIGPTLKLWFAREDFFGCPFINAVGESDKADDRMRTLALAHKKIVLDRLAALCAEAGAAEPAQMAHALGLVMDGAVIAALVTRDTGAADVAGRACAAICAATM